MRFVLVPITVIAAVSGCASPCRIGQGESNASRQVANGTVDQVWESAQESLRRQGWQLDRVDREAGMITTLPRTSQHFFEFWRKDVNSRPDFWEATMTPVRRWAQVQISPQAGGYDVSVMVHKQQLSSPDRQFNSSGAAYQYFGMGLPSTTGRKITPEDDRWVDRGRDAAMEQYVLCSIMETLAQPPE